MKAHRFRSKLMFAALLPSVFLAILLSYLWLTWSQRSLENALLQRMTALAGQIATTAEFHIFTGDVQALRTLTVVALERDAELTGVAILDDKSRLMAKSHVEAAWDHVATPLWPAKSEAYRSRIVIPIRQSTEVLDDPFATVSSGSGKDDSVKPLGYVVLEVSLEILHRERDRQLFLGVLLILAALIGAGGLAVYLANEVTRPIARIMHVVERIGLGATDARVEPDPDCVLFHLEIGINQMAEKVAITQEDLRRRIEAATGELLAQKELAELQARVDPLTGLGNRRAFMERIELELHRAARYGTHLCLIMLDLDYFKDVNDRFGHDAGDKLLVALAEMLRTSIRDVDFTARMGGEEFVVLMPETDLQAARHAAERMRLAVSALHITTTAGEVSCTASFGIAVSEAELGVNAMLVRADKALYAAKNTGRDRVCVHMDSGQEDLGLGRQ